MALNNYVLGRGKIHLARVHGDAKQPGQFRYVGNTPEFNLTAETEDLEHTNPDRGINEVDARVQLSVTRTGSLIMDDIQPENLSLFFFGARQSGARAADAVDQTEVFSGARLSEILEKDDENTEIVIGIRPDDPTGARSIDAANITLAGENSAANPVAVMLAEDVDWEVVDALRGTIRLISTGKTFTAAGDAVLSEITITYRRAAITADDNLVITSGNTAFEGALRFVEDNPEGDDNEWFLPLVTLSPNGDLALKGEEWRQIPLSIAVQKPAGSVEAIYLNGKLVP